jgi:hypothetical protein
MVESTTIMRKPAQRTNSDSQRESADWTILVMESVGLLVMFMNLLYLFGVSFGCWNTILWRLDRHGSMCAVSQRETPINLNALHSYPPA